MRCGQLRSMMPRSSASTSWMLSKFSSWTRSASIWSGSSTWPRYISMGIDRLLRPVVPESWPGWGSGPSWSKTDPRSRISIQPPQAGHLMKCSASCAGRPPTRSPINLPLGIFIVSVRTEHKRRPRLGGLEYYGPEPLRQLARASERPNRVIGARFLTGRQRILPGRQQPDVGPALEQLDPTLFDSALDLQARGRHRARNCRRAFF